MTAKTTTLGLICIGVALVLLVASMYVRTTQKDTRLVLEKNIAEQASRLSAIASLTDSNGADEIAERILQDCSVENRQRFEILLNQLATLEVAALQEMEQLFDACGGFFAERKAIMVARLEREFEVYEDYVSLYQTIDSRAPITEYALHEWSELVSLERERGLRFSEQVQLQRDIITELRSSQADQSVIEAKVVRAQQLTAEVTELNATIDTIRQTLDRV